MNYFVMAVLPLAAWNNKGHPNLYSIGDPPSSTSEQSPEENKSVSALIAFVPGRNA